jgi:excisionase family DNA binding protein
MEILSARDLSKYLKINEKKIYKLAQESKLPFTKIGGKVAFTKELIDKWILENTSREHNIYLAGSDDILLRRIIDLYNQRNEGTVFYAPVGSVNGLRLLKDSAASMSCVHILDVEKKNQDLSYLDRYLSKDEYIVVELFNREQGIIVTRGNPKGIRGMEDIASKNIKFVNRNRGSGTRILVDFLLHEKGVDPAKIQGYTSEIESHLEAGLKVLTGEAEASFGIRHVAHMLNLDFIHQFSERFDLVVPVDQYYYGHVKSFLAFFEQPTLIHNIRDFTGYVITKIGSVIHKSA